MTYDEPSKPSRANLLSGISAKTAGLAAALMIGASLLAPAVTPKLHVADGAASLEATVPASIGRWKLMPQAQAQVTVTDNAAGNTGKLYDQVVMRSYENDEGQVVMLALAGGAKQKQDIKIHRPEVCYPAQGYSLIKLADASPIQTVARPAPIPTVEILASDRHAFEAVRYWIRIGQNYGGDGWSARRYLVSEGLQGRIPDGILVRASQRIDSESGFEASQIVMENFLKDLVAALPQQTLKMLAQ